MKIKYLTRKARREYLKYPGRCPYCGYDDPRYGSIDMDGQEIVQFVSCPECLRMWQDWYRITDILEVDSLCPACRKPVTDEDELVFVSQKGYFHSECVERGIPPAPSKETC